MRMKLPDGTRRLVQVVGLDDATLMGAPPEMVQGRIEDLRKDRAIIVDHDTLASKLRVKREDRALAVGDKVTFNDKAEAIIAGTFKPSKSFFWEPLIYTTYSRARTLALPERRMTTYVLVKVKPGYDKQAVADELTATLGITARTNAQFDRATVEYIIKETGILINFGMAVGLGFLVGALVAGQMLYNFTLDNLRHYAALKALGLTNGRLIAMVLLQAAIVGLIGYGLGVGLGAGLGTLVAKGGLAFLLPWQVMAVSFVLILIICLGSAGLCIAKVLKAEPAMVFK
jgi:putative ABC transport system permease protein